MQNSRERALEFLNFLNASPTPFHAVRNAVTKLEAAGFRRLREKDDWEKDLRPGDKYYFTRNQAALVAFITPANWTQGTGLSIVATHVDSPNLKVRPISKRTKLGYLQVGVETYGGGIWHSWLDRDLSLAGRVVISEPGRRFTSKLVKIDRPLLRIPTLAIHLDRNVNDNFKFNQETEFVPILGLLEKQLNGEKDWSGDTNGTGQAKEIQKASSIQGNHHSELLSVLATEASVVPDEVHDFELCLYDTQPATLGGVNNEFIFGPRLDNLFSSYCAVEAIVRYATGQNISAVEGNVNCVALFNHEEIGSVSTTGAESSLLPTLLSRLSPSPGALAQSISRSFLISADMGHAVHPNYADKHEAKHRPVINGGMIIKTNAKQRYASDAISTFVVKQLVELKGGKVQEFEVRNDIPCGSTVGPMLSKIGVRTVDVGNATLSMHSIRETAGTHDIQNAIDLFSSFYENFASLDNVLTVD